MIHAPLKSGISPDILFVLIYSIHFIGWGYLRYRQHWLARTVISMASTVYVVHHFMRVYCVFSDSSYFQSASSLTIGMLAYLVMLCALRSAFYFCVFTGVYIIVPDWHDAWLVLVAIGILGAVLVVIGLAGRASVAIEFIFITTSTSAMVVMGTATLLQTGKPSEDALDTSRERIWEYLLIMVVVLLRFVTVFVIERNFGGGIDYHKLRDEDGDLETEMVKF
jgi:hypothetical protein